jgi:predicted component of type VI protein secretion system
MKTVTVSQKNVHAGARKREQEAFEDGTVYALRKVLDAFAPETTMKAIHRYEAHKVLSSKNDKQTIEHLQSKNGADKG